MATNRKLRTDLLEKLGVTPQRLYQRVDQIKRTYGPMSTEEGTYFLAHQEGMDLTKYLDSETVGGIRSMVQKGGAVPPAITRSGAKKGPASRPIRIAPKLEIVDAMLPTRISEDAARMADVYPKLYVFENSMRSVITRILEAKHGKGWWSKRVPADVQARVKGRKDDEDKKPWHGKRGSHEIYYSDFKDLRKIIEKNWDDFKALFPTRAWITVKLEELEPPRNIIAHHNPISAQEKKRIELYSDDWIALLNDRRDLVP